MAFNHKEKTSRRKPTFKSFGNFIALHMVKRLVRRNKTNQPATDANVLDDDDKDALEAGFNSHLQNGHANKSKNSNINRSSSMTATNHSSIAVKGGKLLNGISNRNGIDLGLVQSMPGVFGLNNHGNTCFMNSITQCLSNTDLLAEFFVMGQYKQDLKNCRKDRSKKYGTKGEVTEQLAALVRGLWMGLYTPDMTKSLKDTIGKYCSQYKGTSQHDSQEYLLWLFDKIHEDINQQPVKKRNFVRRQSFRKKSKANAENGKVVKDGAANVPDLTPHSFIQKIFQGHYRSTLTCPSCKKKSDTTDPFLCVSLPLKQRTTRPIYVNVVYLPNKRRSGSSRKGLAGKTIKIGVPVEMDGKINLLRQAVAGECGIHSRLLAFVDLHHDGFHQSYGDDMSIADLPASNAATTASDMSLYAFEMPAFAKMTAGTLPRNFSSKHKRRGFGSVKHAKEGSSAGSSTLSNVDSIVVILINKQGVREQGKRFGRPLVFRISRDALLSELQSMILSQMSDHIKNGVKHERLGSLFRLQIVDGLPNKSYISQQVQQPLRLPTVDKALENSPAGGPMHIKLVAEWDTDTKAGIFEKFPEEKIEVQDCVRLQKVLHQQPVTCTLEECFDLHTQEEELGPEDAWHCPHCHKQQHGTVKKLSLYTLPDIFVVHLKRFRVLNGRRTKLSTRVEFPVTGLDMSKHVYIPDPQSPVQSNSPTAFDSRWMAPNTFNGHKSARSPEDNLYDLYAVCNHYGNLNSGHYTACCNNPLDGRWYLFDDSTTECIAEDQLSPQSVYILFYQRRSSSAALSCGGASINSVMSDHWAFNLPQFKQKVEFNSQRHLNHNSVNRIKSFSTSHNKQVKDASPEPRRPSGEAPMTAMQINMSNNSSKIAAAAKEFQTTNLRNVKETKKREKDENSDDGGFGSPNRPYAKGLRRQGSVIVGKPRSEESSRDQLRGRQYRSYRHSRSSRRQKSSHV